MDEIRIPLVVNSTLYRILKEEGVDMSLYTENKLIDERDESQDGEESRG